MHYVPDYLGQVPVHLALRHWFLWQASQKKTEPGTWNLVPKLSDPRNYEVTEALRISFGEGKRDAPTFGMCPEGILSIERPPAFPVP